MRQYIPKVQASEYDQGWAKLTSDISNTEDTDRSSIDDTALVRQERGGARTWDRLGRTARAVGHVATGVIIVSGLLLGL